MCNLSDIKLLIHSISGEENYFTVNKVFVELMESLEAGIFLSQLVYWSDRSNREDGYFYKTYKEWEEEIFVSEYNIRKFTKKLKEMGVVETKVMKANGNPTMHYKVDMEQLSKKIVSFLKKLRNEHEHLPDENETFSQSNPKRFSIDHETIQDGNQKFSESLTKTTTENTTKISHHNVDDENARKEKCRTNVFHFYEQNGFGLLNAHIAEKISTWLDDLNEELVMYAMKLAIENNVLRWNYVESILRNWSNKKLTTISDVKADQFNYSAKQKESSKRLTKTEVVPQWFNEYQNNRSTHDNQPVQSIDFEEERQKVLAKLGRGNS